MAKKKTMAIVVAVCKHCHQVIEVASDQASEDGFWDAPKVGAKIGADIITDVKEINIRNSPLPGFIVELDTRVVPHCAAAR